MLRCFCHRHARICLLFALCFGALTLCTHAQVTATWTGKANDSLWTDSNNWDTHAVPGSNDTAIIDLQGSNVVVLSSNLFIGTIELGGQGTNILELTGISIQCTGLISITNGGILEITSNSTVVGGSFQNSGTIDIPAGLGELTLTTNCSFTNSGVIDIETNSILDLVSSPLVFESGTVFNGPGTVNLASGFNCDGQITANGIVLFNSSQGGNVVWTGSGLLQFIAGEMSNVTFAPDFQVEMIGPYPKVLLGECTNQGTIRLLGTGFLDANPEPSFNGVFCNSGVLQIETNCGIGGFALFQNTGTIRMPANLGELSLTNECNFTNYGAIDVETNSILDLVAPYTESFAAFESGSDFVGPGTVHTIGLGNVFYEGTITVNGTLEYDSDAPQNGNSFWTGPGLLRWLGGGLNNVTFSSGFHVEVSGDNYKFASVGTNQGTVRWLGGGYLNDDVNGGQFYNSGLVQIEADGIWNNTPIKNQSSGIFRQLAGNFSIASLTNCGTVDLQSGELNVASNFFSGSNSVYQITLNGTTPGTNYNQLTAQNLALNGSLKVVLTNGFLPVSGNSFVIANDSSQSGTFSNLTVPTFQSNLVMNVRYSPGSVLLEVDPVFFGLTNSLYTNGTFQFSLNGPPASAYDIQASSNLIDWITIGTNSPFTGTLNFTDTNASIWDHRFYRARIYP